jgi:hypothetical protein
VSSFDIYINLVKGIQTPSGTHPVTYAVGTVATSLRSKATGACYREETVEVYVHSCNWLNGMHNYNLTFTLGGGMVDAEGSVIDEK